MAYGKSRRVVITGLGILSSVGIGKEQFWDALSHGRSGVTPITCFDAHTYPVRIAGQVNDFDPHTFYPYELTRRLSRFSLLGLAAAKLAAEDSGLSIPLSCLDRERTCVVVGTSLGAFFTQRKSTQFLSRRDRDESHHFSITARCQAHAQLRLVKHWVCTGRFPQLQLLVRQGPRRLETRFARLETAASI